MNKLLANLQPHEHLLEELVVRSETPPNGYNNNIGCVVEQPR